MLDLDRYFLPEINLYLIAINYEKKADVNDSSNLKLVCSDDLDVSYSDTGIQLIFTRKLEFIPSALYMLTISYGAELTFNDKTKDEIKWNTIDLAKEIRESNSIFLSNIITRASLLIAQISSSYGQMPLITPPNFII